MFHKPSLALLALGGLVLSAPAVHAQTNVISFSFEGNSDTPSAVFPNLSAGVVPAMNFNNDTAGNSGSVTNGSKGLAYSDATPSGVTLSYSSYDAQNNKLSANPNYNTDGNQQLMNGFIESGPPAAANAAATVTVSSVPFSSYSLYVYAFNGSPELGTYTVTPSGSVVGTSQTAIIQGTFDPANPFTMATATTAGDYLLFTGLTASSFTLTANRTASDTASTTFIPIDGFQIVGTPAAAVPEVSTTVSLGLLLSLGLAGMLTARRRTAGKRAGKGASA